MEEWKLTDAGVDNAPSDGAFEEAGAAIATEGAIVLAIGLVAANKAGGGGGKAAA